MSLAQRAQAAAETVSPGCSVIIGRADDRSTWVVQPVSPLTDQQALDIAALFANIAPNAPDVPQSVTPYQARCALDAAGLLDAVEAIVAQSTRQTRNAWEYGISVERNSPMINDLGAALGLTAAQIDQLFITANGIS